MLGDALGSRLLVNELRAKSHNIDRYNIGACGEVISRRPPGEASTDPLACYIFNESSSPDEVVGNITIARQPNSSLLASLHLTNVEAFDMDGLFCMLTSDHSKAYMKGCLSPDSRHQRSFCFSFNYHCIIGGRPGAIVVAELGPNFIFELQPIIRVLFCCGSFAWWSTFY
jgi:hypothetical protein